MRILVTGGAGFIGSNLVMFLVRKGHQVLNVDKLTYAGNQRSLDDVQQEEGYQFLEADILDEERMARAFEEFRPQWVMHLAAESHVDRSIDGPRAFLDTNVIGTFNLLQVARRYYEALEEEEKEVFRFLHVSTDEVYGELGREGYFTEETPYDPHSPYSASKAASDHFARAWYSTYGLPVIVTNCSNNYGPRQFPEKLIPLVILKALKEDPIPVYGQGIQTRDWLYVEDHCEALFCVISKGKPGRMYNIGGNNERKNIDLVRLICRVMDELSPRDGGQNHESLITFVQDRPGHDFRYAMDISRIKGELGWEPKRDHEAGIRETVQWYLNNREWWEEILNGSYQLERLGKGGFTKS